MGSLLVPVRGLLVPVEGLLVPMCVEVRQIRKLSTSTIYIVGLTGKDPALPALLTPALKL
jgi:hypothetical protein